MALQFESLVENILNDTVKTGNTRLTDFKHTFCSYCKFDDNDKLRPGIPDQYVKSTNLKTGEIFYDYKAADEALKRGEASHGICPDCESRLTAKFNS